RRERMPLFRGRGELFMHAQQRGKIERRAVGLSLSGKLLKCIGTRYGDIGFAHVVDRFVHVPDQGEKTSLQRRQTNDRIADERQRPSPQCALNEAWVDVRDTVAKALG